MDSEYGFKELYFASIKATFSMDINDRKIEAGETIAYFDKIQMANFNETRQKAMSSGGYDNRVYVNWDEPQSVNFTFRHGIFSRQQLSMLTNSQLISYKRPEPFIISKRLTTESDEKGLIRLPEGEIPVGRLFIYNDNSDKLPYNKIDNLTYSIGTPYINVIVDYNYEYESKVYDLVMGRRFFNGYVHFEGKTRVVDDVSGNVRTALLRIPRLKIDSDLTITLGQKVAPTVGAFSGIGYPVGKKADKRIMDILFLDDDIDSDIK